jgi:hypothetical protein
MPSEQQPSSSDHSLLRHTLATVAYRANKALQGAPPSFATFALGETPRTPAQILAHMGDLFDWALSMARGKVAWRDSKPLEWSREVERFYSSLAAFDGYLASGETVHAGAETLFQGPVADALTHIGQLAMLRRLAGCKIKGENYSRAKIAAGQVSAKQPAPVREF